MTKHWSPDNNRNSYPAAPTSEGSALFSLNELKAKAEAAARVNKPMKRDDNSGLIDLKAMMAQAEQENAAEAASALHVTPHLAVYPFGAPVSQPKPASAQEKAERPRALRRLKRGRAASIGIAAALLSIAAVAAAAVSGGFGAFEVPRQALASPVPTVLQWAMVPSEMAPASSENAEIASAQPSPSEKESETTLATPRPPKEIPHIAKAPVLNRTPGATTAAPKAPTAAPAPPASDPCKGDLMCAMQRAVKK